MIAKTIHDYYVNANQHDTSETGAPVADEWLALKIEWLNTRGGGYNDDGCLHGVADALRELQDYRKRENKMEYTKVYELKMQPGESQLWENPDTRAQVIAGGIDKARDNDCCLLRVLDTDGNQLHLEGFKPRLWDLVCSAHEKIEKRMDHLKNEATVLQAMLSEAFERYNAGDLEAAHRTIKAAMDKEFFMFGSSEYTGNPALLEALGYDIEQDMPLMSMG